MEYAYLVVIAICLGAGVGGGLLSAWSCHRRVLALEVSLKVILTGFDDQINQLTKIVVRQDKSEAAKARWSKKDLEETTLAKQLTDNIGQPSVIGPGHAWDPRTWGKG
jgi:hypothetical protein